jgi:hypothetical protein
MGFNPAAFRLMLFQNRLLRWIYGKRDEVRRRGHDFMTVS